MIKKISVLSLILFFTASSLSLPITVHLCSMNMNHQFCKMETAKSNSFNNVCNSEEMNFQQQVFAEHDNCCSTRTIDLSITDAFINNKTECSLSFSAFAVMPSLKPTEFYNFVKTSKISFRHFHLPDIYGNNIYLGNSTFLI